MRRTLGSAVAVLPLPARRGRLIQIAAALCLLVAGCGGGAQGDVNRVRGDALTIYSSGPRHGVSAAAGEAAFAGERLALERAGGRADGRRIRLVRLTATRPGDTLWDPGTVRANAERAREDPSAIAYLGELDYGGSAVSLPVTNRAKLLQVSPTDGLASLTRTPPGRPTAGPARYYPEGLRTFARLVPNDLVVAGELTGLLRRRRLTRVAVVYGEGIANRELVAALVARLRAARVEPVLVEPLRDEVDGVEGLVGKLAAARAGGVVHVGIRNGATAAALAALARRLPLVPVFGDAGLLDSRPPDGPEPREVRALTAVLPPAAQSTAGRRVLATLERERGKPVLPEALYGFEAMRLVLAAIDRAGPDRRGVVRAALTSGVRKTVLGPLSLGRSGDVRTRRLALMRLRDGHVVFDRVLP